MKNHCDCVSELRSGPPAPGQKFSTYHIYIIHDWYHDMNQSGGDVYSRCKLKAVPSNSQVLHSVHDTIHLDIINVGYGKEVIEYTYYLLILKIINFCKRLSILCFSDFWLHNSTLRKEWWQVGISVFQNKSIKSDF